MRNIIAQKERRENKILEKPQDLGSRTTSGPDIVNFCLTLGLGFRVVANFDILIPDKSS